MIKSYVNLYFRTSVLCLWAHCAWSLILPLLIGCIGNGDKEDSWSHYKAGGLFLAGTPSVSPDGSKIVFSSPRSGRGDIVRVNRDGSGRVTLAGSDDFEAVPVYSPDGTKIAYVREKQGDRHIWIMNSDGSRNLQLTFGRVLDDLVDFSPDGSGILFDRSVPTGGNGRSLKSYFMRVDGSGLQPRPAGVVERGKTSHDGKTLIQSVYDGASKSYEIISADREGSGRRLMGKGIYPVYSPDYRHIFYCSSPYASDLCVMDADGARSRVVPTPPGTKTAPRVSGKVLSLGVYIREEREPSVILVDIDNIEVLNVLRDAPMGAGDAIGPGPVDQRQR